MKRLLCIALLVPALAFAGADRRIITKSNFSSASAGRYVIFTTGSLTSVANGAIVSVLTPVAGRLVDAVVYQQSAGTGGTSFTIDLKTVGGTSLLTTLPIATLASGADKLTDVRGDLTLPSGWTRPVLKTDGTEVVTKGQRLIISTVETGTYSPHVTFFVQLWFEPAQ